MMFACPRCGSRDDSVENLATVVDEIVEDLTTLSLEGTGDWHIACAGLAAKVRVMWNEVNRGVAVEPAS